MKAALTGVEVLAKPQVQHLPEPRHHRLYGGCGGGAGRKAIAIGKEVPFEGRSFRIEIADQRYLAGGAQKILRIDSELLLQDARDIEAVRAFGNHDEVVIDAAVNQLPVNVARAQ